MVEIHEMDKRKNRILYFDMLNIIATLAVVWLHFSNEIHWYENTSRWTQACVVQAIGYFAVPIFFMLTGATLLDYRKKYDTKTFFKIIISIKNMRMFMRFSTINYIKL